MPERRFDTETDTPCPFRLARFGYRRTGEFRSPRQGEQYIEPTDGPKLQEHEPVILGACADHKGGEARHIVLPISEKEQATMADPITQLMAAFIEAFGSEDEDDLAGSNFPPSDGP